MITHHVTTAGDVEFYSPSNSSNGDTFDLSAPSAGMAIWALSNVTIQFLSTGDHATIEGMGRSTIYDRGQGSMMIFTAGDGPVTIYDFQHDKTGYIREMGSASSVAHLTPSSDGHGGSFLTGPQLSIHLVGDPTVAASHHS